MQTHALYIHIPFCESICSYCDFCKVFYNEKIVDRYLDELERELYSIDIDECYTIYIGGGTPSSLNDTQLERLCDMIQPFITSSTKEITIEVNPESMDCYKLDILKRGKINRLSIGVQTFQDHLLQHIERHHNQKQVLSLIQYAQDKGFKNISIDMMYGLPKQTIDDLKDDLAIISTLNINHLSYYSLILEDHTVLKNQNYTPIDEETDYEYNLLIEESLKRSGFEMYEVSNYAKEGYQSLHNLSYWHFDNYRGVGIGAVSKIDDSMLTHSRELNKYLNHQDIVSVEILDKEDLMFDHLMMSLRLKEGMSISSFNERYQVSLLDYYKEAIDKHLRMNTLVIDQDCLKTTKESIKLLNTILEDFL